MTKRLVFAAAMLLAGCATPTLRESGVRSEYTLQLPPVKAAQCMARNAKDFWFWYDAQILGVTLGLEVTVVSLGATVAVADIRPANGGSTADIFRKRTAVTAIGLPAAMAKGC